MRISFTRGLRNCVVLLLPALVAVSACAERDADAPQDRDTLAAGAPGLDTLAKTPDGPAQSIYDVLREDSRFSRLAEAVDSAGLAQTFSGPGPFTIFAPTDDAFTALQDADALLSPENRDRLRGVLLFHVSNGEKTADALQAGASIRSLEGSDVSVSGLDDSLRVGGATVTDTDIRARNGVIHAVDRVLRPDADEG